jgi:hypothetical protein
MPHTVNYTNDTKNGKQHVFNQDILVAGIIININIYIYILIIMYIYNVFHISSSFRIQEKYAVPPCHLSELMGQS